MTKRFSQTHEWVVVEGEIATIGISDFAQKELGEVVYAELPAVGKKIKAGDTAIILESTKAAVDIDSPLSGEILEVNSHLKESPQIINSLAESEGWLFKLRLHKPDELNSLMSESDYKRTISGT